MFCMGNDEHENVQQDSTAKKIENYIFKYDDLLGKGNFGSAYSGCDVNNGNQVAIKVIKMNSIKTKVSEKLLENQIQILKSLKSHPNILRCYDVFTSVNNCYIITELCDHDLQKDLVQKGKFKEGQIKQLAYGIYKGLEQLNKNFIIHRDLKISNIFLSQNGLPKIADFGFAIKSKINFKDLNIGSPLYMSPQGLIQNVYGLKTDVWSFGVLLYQLVNGQTPLERCRSDIQLREQIILPPRFFNQISNQLRQVIQACLTVDQKRRPTIFQLGTLPYFKRLFSQFQGRPYSLKQSSHKSTVASDNGSPFSNQYFFKKDISYQDAINLLHYCRLLHKINKKYINSQIFSQYLINLSFQLCKCNISNQGTLNEQYNKLKKVLTEYHNKFLLEYIDMKNIINPRQVISEIQKFIICKEFNINQLLQILDSQTKVLVYSIQHQNADIFTKNSEAKKVIQNGKLL